jgi:hypothetical protein
MKSAHGDMQVIGYTRMRALNFKIDRNYRNEFPIFEESD